MVKTFQIGIYVMAALNSAIALIQWLLSSCHHVAYCLVSNV